MTLCLDACVLYPTVLRRILLGLAARGLFTPIWSARILEEWRRAAGHDGPVAADIAGAEAALLTVRWPQALIAADGAREASLWLPDPADIHVLATAVTGGAEAIVTLNLRDFPARELAPMGLKAVHPDPLIHGFWLETPQTVSEVVSEVIAEVHETSDAPLTARDILKRARLPRLGKALAR